MRRHPGTDDIALPNEEEIEAALSAAMNASLDDLLTNEEFAAKYAPPSPPAVVAEDDAAEPQPDDEPDTIALPMPGVLDELPITRAA